MNNTTYIICAAALLIAFLIYYMSRWNRNRSIDSLNKTEEQNKDHSVPVGECCGKHTVCEKQKLAEARLHAAKYFDDEELDRFRGRHSHEYEDSDIEEFRYVMYTMKQQEVREWMECLTARGIELPDALKEECFALMNEYE